MKKSLFLSWMPRQKALFADLWNEPSAMNWRVWLPFRGALIVWRNRLTETLWDWAKVNPKSDTWDGVIPGIGEPSLRANVQKSSLNLWKLNMNQKCVPVMMKADCVPGFISECVLQVDGLWDSFRICCPSFGSSALRKTLRTKSLKWEATEMLCGRMPGEALRSGWIFSVLKQKATIGFISVFNYFLQGYRENEVKH